MTSLGQKKSSKKLDQDFINLIDDLFLKLEMSYHYQFYKVFGDDERLKEGKKLWALSLKKFDNHHIKGGISKVVAKNDFLPTLSDFIKCCEERQSHLILKCQMMTLMKILKDLISKHLKN